jgi:hypothetical protein
MNPEEKKENLLDTHYQPLDVIKKRTLIMKLLIFYIQKKVQILILTEQKTKKMKIL